MTNEIEDGLQEKLGFYYKGVETTNDRYKAIAGRQLKNGNNEVMTVYKDVKRKTEKSKQKHLVQEETSRPKKSGAE
jgi:hypothetical protein